MKEKNSNKTQETKSPFQINSTAMEQELEDLRVELQNYEKEKENIRLMLGKVGGVPSFHSKLINILFIIALVATLVVSILVHNSSVRLLMLELASAAVSIKIIYLIHCLTKVNHFKFWMLSSIEWRLNQMMKEIRKISDHIEND